MTKMKSILLGAAAGLATVASAQAADLPVKAAPVEYVKVCSLYGAGFFYIPGTDTCLKIGGYLRSDHFYGAANSGGFFTGATGQNANFPAGVSNPVQQNLQDRTTTDNYGFRARMNLTVDFRTQSDYGTIRAYAAIIAQQQTNDGSGTGTAGVLRAFIQFAGFTVGHAVSYFDFINGADYGYVPSTTAGMGGTGVNGIDLIAYTWQIGNGFSASVDIEDNNSSGGGRGKFVINASNNAQNFGNSVAITQFPLVPGSQAVAPGPLHGDMPDLAANLRVDQAWGSAQIMGAIHNASGGYYSNFPGLTQAGPPLGIGGNSQVFGHPGEAWGWSVGVGAKLVNFILPRDQIEFQAGYCKGAIGYCLFVPNATNAIFGNGNTVGLGYGVDGVFTNGGTVQLSDSWAWAVGYQHYWNPQWRTGTLFGQSGVIYNSTASQMICGTAPGSLAAGQIAFFQPGGLPQGIGLNGLSNCSPSFSQESINVRTAWNPHPFLEIGLDLGMMHLNTANKGQAFLFGTPNQLAGVGGPNVNNGVRPPGVYNVADQNQYYVALRFQKNILP
jgi:Porin subfamily